MPTYEYKCPKCGTRFERFQRITAPPTLPCPKCGKRAERLISGGHGLVFKGSGFYETDYKQPGEKAKHDKKKKAEGGAPSTEKPSTPSKPDAPKADSKAE